MEPALRSPASRPHADRGSVLLSAVSKIYDGRQSGLNARAGNPWKRLTPIEPIVALSDLDLEVPSGRSVALIGPNGSGKTTILKLIAGVTAPSAGVVEVGGRVGSLIELGIGFHPELTGWQNLRCSARLLGLDRRSIRDAEVSIAEFAGLGAAMDAPLRTYSSGMIARLGFAVATSVPCDVLLVDEVLAVGDQDFRNRCFERIGELHDGGTTLLLVTHQLSLAAGLCDQAVHVRGGRLVDEGPATEVVRRYRGGSPARFHQIEDPPVRWRYLGHPSERQESGKPFCLVAEIEVERSARDVRWAVELSLAAHPEYVFASDAGMLGQTLEPGSYRLRAQGSPIIAQSADIFVEATLLTDRATEVMDTTSTRLAFRGPWTDDVRPRMATSPRWRVERITERPHRAMPVSEQVAELHSGPELVRVSSVRKTFLARTGEFARRTGWPFRGSSRVHALMDVSLAVESGTTVGVVGGNGAGKTTLLGTIAGTVAPDAGSVKSSGRVVPALGLGLGFHPDLSGRQNLELAALLLGLTRKQYEATRDVIEHFTQFGEVLDRPVRTYSTGMEARLGVALALHASPDVLLIDEVLAVGDQDFRNRSLAALEALRRSGTATLFVSHELDLVAEACSHSARMSKGAIIDVGRTHEVLERYGAVRESGRLVVSLAGIIIGEVHDLRVQPCIERPCSSVVSMFGKALVSRTGASDAAAVLNKQAFAREVPA